MDEFGKRAEDLIESICHRMFLAEFTVRSPFYEKQNGIKKEATDILIPFGNTLIAIQVKSHAPKPKALEDSDIESQRISSKIGEGVGQLKTIRRAVRNNAISNLKTAKGIELPFKCADIKKIIGVVIIEVLGDAALPREEQALLINGFEYLDETPVHTFKRGEFEAIASEIDTVPDFIHYLDDREVLRSKSILNPASEELDLLAMYKSRYDTVQESVRNGSPFLTLAPGIWEEYRKNTTAQEKRRKLNQPSYIIDDLISKFHTSIGYKAPEMEQMDPRWTTGQGTPAGYGAAILELARLSRLARRAFGNQIIAAIKRSETQPYAYTLAGFTNNQEDLKLGKFSEVYLFLAEKSNRKFRTEKLQELCSCAYCHFGLKKVVGIATEAGLRGGLSFDIAIMSDVSFYNHDELAAKGKLLFPNARHSHNQEWGV